MSSACPKCDNHEYRQFHFCRRCGMEIRISDIRAQWLWDRRRATWHSMTPRRYDFHSREWVILATVEANRVVRA